MAAPPSNSEIAAATPAQINALAPHLKMAYSTVIRNETLLHHETDSDQAMAAYAAGLPVALSVAPPMRRPIMAKRSVNSWMTFRSYYSHCFMDIEQKNTSVLLTAMWSREPFKAKWSILARAYTVIRDFVGKRNAPLNVFLNLVCPEMGIISVNDYMMMMNWSLVVNDGIASLTQFATPDINSFDEKIRNSIMTEKDVIEFSATNGYISITDATSMLELAASHQTGLLATHQPGHQPAQPQQPMQHVNIGTVNLVGMIANDVEGIASYHLGFNVTEFIHGTVITGNGTQWTGSNSDVYDSNHASADFVSENPVSSINAFNIQNAEEFREALERGGNGSVMPLIPEDGTEGYFGEAPR